MSLAPREIRAVLADDHHFFRQGLRDLLTDAGVTVVGEATEGAGAVELTRRLAPDVVVIDLHMSGVAGLDAVREIVHAADDVDVIVLTVSAQHADAIAAILAGACGYLLKDTPVDELAASVRLAASGHAVVSRSIVRTLAERAARVPRMPEGQHASELTLTPRELEVIRLITEGADNAAIGRELSISRHTVKRHVTNIFDKLGVESRVQAAVFAVRSGLV
jgi:two-component system nitrate/nitrite response regulator NarL